MHRLICVVLLAACGGSSPKSSESTMPGNTGAAPADGPSCDTMTSHMLDTMSAGKQPVPPEKMKDLHDLFVAHCEKDKWSAQARTCFMNMKTMAEGNACSDTLTEAQKHAMDQEMTPGEGAPKGSGPTKDSGGTRGGPHKGGDPCDGGE
ncbi:MAG: hypothetical protein ABI678_24755 [Kofleriaceae bacterium]